MTDHTGQDKLARIHDIIRAEQSAQPPARAKDMAAAIAKKHPDTVQAFVFYGSGLREADNLEKMLDYYVLAKRYTDIHGVGLKAFLSFALPPSVHFLEASDTNGAPMSSKYSIVSYPAFLRRVSGQAREPMIWARFSQPCLIMAYQSEEIKDALSASLAQAVLHFAEQVRPLVSGAMTPRAFWARALAESYRTELRAERPLERATEIVERYGDRYDALAIAIFGPADPDGLITIPASKPIKKQACRLKWATRRWIGKPATAMRVLKAAFTFDGGLDYVLHKLKSHSGKDIQVSDAQRRHPILWSPIIAWKIWRSGALRHR